MPVIDELGSGRPLATSGWRPVRSYVIRGGRLTSSQRKALESLSADVVVEYRPQPLDLVALFRNRNPVVIEVGFGMGDSLLAMAAKLPDTNFLGIEVHQPGIGKLLMGIDQEQLNNIRVIDHDAREVMEHCIADGSLRGIQIFFPDPWHKKRHHKRRLIQTEFVALLQRKLEAGGHLRLATDWRPYAEQMLEVLDNTDGLVNQAGTGLFADPGDRPATKFEKRGRKLGHDVWDLCYERG